MSRADLHVHTKYSDHPSEWFLQRLGASESYTEPEVVYATAKARGMDFIAITDHNTIEGALELKAAHPDDVIVGVEATTYFPEDGCKVHVLVWGLDEDAFVGVQAARADIYTLREFLQRRGLAHAVAHATFSVNSRLTTDHLEKLVLLFNNFETLNGSRTKRQNVQWAMTLEHLTPKLIASLARKHRIEPTPDRPWLKGTTGGSDDHAGLLIGRTWTQGDAATPTELLGAIRRRETVSAGRHNDYRSLAFSVYKIAIDFSQSKSLTMRNVLAERLHSGLYGRPPATSAASTVTRVLTGLRASKDPLGARLIGLCDELENARHAEMDDRFDIAYDYVAKGTDELLGSVLRSAADGVSNGDLTTVMREASAGLTAAFVAAPFFTTLGALSRGRAASDGFVERHSLGVARQQRTLWFTDTLTDLNGVSVTLQQVARAAESRGDELRVVTCGCQETPDLPRSIIKLPGIFEFELPYYESYKLGVPSPLQSLRVIQSFEPDQIIVSTPGPTGLLGLAAARLLDIPCTFVYHTDYGAQLSRISEDESPAEIVDEFVHWLCRHSDAVLVPSKAYRERLAEVGVDPAKIKPFSRGIDSVTFSPLPGARSVVFSRYGIPEGFTLMYSGRVSREKSLDVLVAAYERVIETRPDVNLLIVGDGPYAAELRERTAHLDRVFLLGKVPNAALPEIYSAVDLFCFPSRTDTFGMAVLEAQACAVPALVSDAGGPQDIVLDGVTGRVVQGCTVEAWAEALTTILHELHDNDVALFEMSCAARKRAEQFDWNTFLDEILGPTASRHKERELPDVSTVPA